MLPLHSLLLAVFICWYSSSSTLVQYWRIHDLQAFWKRNLTSYSKENTKIAGDQDGIKKRERIPCRSSNPACDTSPLLSSNSAESVRCRPAHILPKSKFLKILYKQKYLEGGGEGTSIEREKEWNINKEEVKLRPRKGKKKYKGI